LELGVSSSPRGRGGSSCGGAVTLALVGVIFSFIFRGRVIHMTTEKNSGPIVMNSTVGYPRSHGHGSGISCICSSNIF
jgi:hypothetical protein